MEERETVVQETGLKAAVAEVLVIATEAYRLAASSRASMNPQIAALAPLYETIGQAWEAQASRILEANPPTPSPHDGREGTVGDGVDERSGDRGEPAVRGLASEEGLDGPPPADVVRARFRAGYLARPAVGGAGRRIGGAELRAPPKRAAD